VPAGRLPERTRVYQNHHLDSTRWDGFEPRPGDIVITTAYKAGTTWMQAIVSSLLFGDAPPKAPWTLTPWLDMRVYPLELIRQELEGQRHRRFVKTHLALDGLPFFPEAKYVYVGRHGPDVFMSLWNHYTGYTPETVKLLNETPGLVGPPQPPPPADPRELWRSWATRGWFPWEFDGWPYWSLLHHVRTWWEWRHLPNLLFVHFNDLLADLDGEMRRVAEFLEIEVPRGEWAARVELATFASMKERAEQIVPAGGVAFQGGAQRFLYKGTNGRFREVLTEGDLALWQDNVARQLAPACARWLEHGGPI
jgi:aryl sulfotransferase